MTEPSKATEALVRHAKARSDDARQRIEKAIRDLRRQKSPINVNAVARAAGVTRKTVYAHKDLHARIRARNPVRPASTTTIVAIDQAEQHSSIVAALRRQLNTQTNAHRDQISQLKAQLKAKELALAAAHGEIHKLMNQLQHQRPASADGGSRRASGGEKNS